MLKAIITAAVIGFVSIQQQTLADQSQKISLKDLSYAAIKQTIIKYNIRSIDDLLPLLPEEYRKNFALLYKSKSLQYASPDKPRTILYGKDAKLILAFSGDPAKPGFNNLEISEWDSKNAKFVLREIEFPSADQRRGKVSSKFYEENPPSKCISCHTSSPRPNWDPYNSWRGTYGSLNRQKTESIRDGTIEDQYYRQFLAQSRHAGRYAFLPEWKGSKDSVLDGNGGPTTGMYPVYNGAGATPNGTLSDLLGPLNFQRIARMISSSPQYESRKFDVLAYLYSCDFSRSRSAAQKESFDELKKKIAEKSKAQFMARSGEVLKFNDAGNYSDRNPQDFVSIYASAIAQLYLIAKTLNIDPEVLSTAFDRGLYEFQTGYINIPDLQMALLKELKDRDPNFVKWVSQKTYKEFRPLDNPGTFYSNGTDDSDWISFCEEINSRRYSGQASQAKQVSVNSGQECEKTTKDTLPDKTLVETLEPICNSLNSSLGTPRALTRCMACHAGPNATAGNIPFHDPTALADYLKRKTKDHRPRLQVVLEELKSKRMPLDSPDFSEEDRGEIEKYLTELAR